jgi:hypothetical protein
MNLEFVSQILAALAVVFTILAFGWRLKSFNSLPRPIDQSNPKGSPGLGVGYALTIGMAPWAKESTRRHWLAYMRGVAFHGGIFLGLGTLLVSPWLHLLSAGLRTALAVATASGTILGVIGFIARLVEVNLRILSTLDDYLAVLLVSLFLAAATATLLNPAYRIAFYFVSSLMLVYAPLGKIRHCIYYAFSRIFFGQFIGRRAVLPHSQVVR